MDHSPSSPFEADVEMYQRAKTTSFIPSIQVDFAESRLSIVEEVPTPRSPDFLDLPRAHKPRPISEVTEIFDSDSSEEPEEQYGYFEEAGEDELSEFEEDFEDETFSHPRGDRHSHSTISTVDENSTPRLQSRRRFDLAINVRPVEGPRGPHLFHASRGSTDSTFDYALQLSPLVPKRMDLRINTEFTNTRAIDQNGAPTPTTIASAVGMTATYEEQTWNQSEPRTWTPQQVAMWMHNLNIDPDIIEKFEVHDITGAILLDLQFDDLKELGVDKFGKRHAVWNHIRALEGGEVDPPSQAPTPFQDIDRPMSRQQPQPRGIERLKNNDYDDCKTPITPGGGRRRRRKIRKDGGFDPVTPYESVSIVAIEQLIPKPHKCAKGENCSKWRKQQRLLRKLHEEHGFPISPENGGQIFMTGDPGNAMQAPNILSNMQTNASGLLSPSIVGPSVVASSDVLGPGDMPTFALHEDSLRQVEERDAQDNVRNFLAFQHVEPPTVFFPPQEDEEPLSPDTLELYPQLQPPQKNAMSPLTSSLQRLPRLEIPRSHTAQSMPSFNQQGIQTYQSAFEDTFSPCMTALASPIQGVYRFGTPASDMDIPVTTVPMAPIARDTSQSVPPDMQYRNPEPRAASRMASRRPSYQLPAVVEEETFSPMLPPTIAASVARRHLSRPSQDSQISIPSSIHTIESQPSMPISYSTGPTEPSLHSTSNSIHQPTDTQKSFPPPLPSQISAKYPGVNHAGWMKKRKTKLLRHEWQDAHFRLKGSELNMHKDEASSSRQLETLNLDEYTIGCSSISSNKLAAKLKAFKLGSSSSMPSSNVDKNGRPGSSMSSSTSSSFNQQASLATNVSANINTPFEFQLVPAMPGSSMDGNLNGESMSALRRAVAGAKTHHFAVKTRDERMDWMREIMLAKALRAKERGFDVQVNNVI